MSTRVRNSQEYRWRENMLAFILPRLARDKEAAMNLILAGLVQARNDGVNDCASILGTLAGHATGERKAALLLAHETLKKLHALNAATLGES